MKTTTKKVACSFYFSPQVQKSLLYTESLQFSLFQGQQLQLSRSYSWSCRSVPCGSIFLTFTEPELCQPELSVRAIMDLPASHFATQKATTQSHRNLLQKPSLWEIVNSVTTVQLQVNVAFMVEFSVRNLRQKKKLHLVFCSCSFSLLFYQRKCGLGEEEIIMQTYQKWEMFIFEAPNIFVTGCIENCLVFMWADYSRHFSQVILGDRILIGHQNISYSPTMSKIPGTSGLFKSLLSGSKRSIEGFVYAFFLFFHFVASDISSIILKRIIQSSTLVSLQVLYNSVAQQTLYWSQQKYPLFLAHFHDLLHQQTTTWC